MSNLLLPNSMSTDGLLTTVHPMGNESIDDLVLPYWKQFDIASIPDSWHYAVAAWMTFFGILGTLGNLLVIYVFASTKALRTASNLLIMNLALGDMLFSVINGFPILTISAINKKWVWGRMWCEIYGFTGGICGLLSINVLAWIAIDRYMVITNPLGGTRLSKGKAMLYLLICWINAAIWGFAPFFGWGAYVPEGFQTSCTFDYLTKTTGNVTFVAGMYMFGFIMPVLILFFCYMGIVSAVFAHNKEMQATAKRMGAQTTSADANKKQEIQIAKVSAMTVGTFMLSWTPYATVAAFGMLMPHSAMFVTPLMSEIPVMFAKASASYNPIIYAMSHPKFRAELDKRFPFLVACCKPKPKPVLPTKSATNNKEDSSQATVTETVEMSRSPTQENVNQA